MELLSIGVKENNEEVKNIIKNYFDKSQIDMIEVDFEDRFYYNLYSNEIDEDDINIYMKDVFSRLVSDIIVKVYLKDIIFKRVFILCKGYNRDEKEQIINIANGLLEENKFTFREKNVINTEIADFLEHNKDILVDGFVNFRLGFLKNIVDGIIEKSIEDFTAEKEYKEFIKILQYFIDIQEPKLDLVNVVIKKEEYKLFDKNNKLIESEFFTEIMNELVEEGISRDDLLISSLITIAPKKLIIHADDDCKNKDIIKVLQNVFSDKVSFCQGCNLCTLQLPLKKEK
jgi:putative sporulation protein YtxC